VNFVENILLDKKHASFTERAMLANGEPFSFSVVLLLFLVSLFTRFGF
jgi:hypothetical protein